MRGLAIGHGSPQKRYGYFLGFFSYFFSRSSMASSIRLPKDSSSSTERCFNFFISSSSTRVENTFFWQTAIKKQKAQHGVSEPSPANPTPQEPLTQGGGVPSDTLHAEPLIDKIPPPESNVKTEPLGVILTYETANRADIA